MSQPSQSRKFQHWLSTAASIQIGILLVTDVILSMKLGAISQRLRDSLYAGGVATDQVDKVNQTLFAIGVNAHWLMLMAIGVTVTVFGSLICLTKIRQDRLQK